MADSRAIVPTLTESISIPGIQEPLVEQYFTSFNAGDFQRTVALFAEDGVLFPPFENGILGREAIATYLQTEAHGMMLHPCQGTSQFLDAETREVEVSGYVKTPLFGVNVRWIFVLNGDNNLQSVGIVLLASLQELLHLRPR